MQPPLIFIMADQLRTDVLGTYGDTQCPTPRLDLLADRATTFERHFTPCPLCVPARTSLLTGLDTHHHGAIINGWFPPERPFGTLRPNTPTLLHRLVNAGYDVIHAGVQHVRATPDIREQLPTIKWVGPASPGEHHAALKERGLMLPDIAGFRDPVMDFNEGKPVVFHGTSPRTAIFPLRENLYFDCTLTQNILDALAARDQEKPLALFCMFWLPHPPLWAPQTWADRIDPASVVMPPTVGRWFTGQPATQLANLPGATGAHVTLEQWRRSWAMYLGMVGLLDQCVGRVLAALDHAGLFDPACVMFTSDHGEMLGAHGMFQKMCMYEEAVHVPLMIKMPGQTQPRRARELTNHLDLSATLLDLAAAPPLPKSPGSSLRDAATGTITGKPARRHIFARYDGNAGRGFHQTMARSTTHKLIHTKGDHSELYDLIEDPLETRNLLGHHDHADVERELRSALDVWMRS